MVPTTPTASRRMKEVWSAGYSALALPSRCRAAPAKKAMLSMLPGTSNSAGQPDRLAGLADLLGDDLPGMSFDQFGQLEQDSGPFGRGRRRPSGKAARAEATATSTSAGVASASSATGSPVAGLMTL